MLSLVVQLDNMTRSAELLTMPNGTRSFPARSCCDLKEQYPEMPSGKYIIAPTTLTTIYCSSAYCICAQVCTGLTPTVDVPLMVSRFTATMRMEAVLHVLMPMSG